MSPQQLKKSGKSTQKEFLKNSETTILLFLVIIIVLKLSTLLTTFQQAVQLHVCNF